MSLEIIGMAMEACGTICIAIAALSVHHRFLNEHRVDQKVLTSMKEEQKVGIFGIALVVLGFAAQVVERIFFI